ncbi:putative flippase [Sulfuricella denitrificans skB26]|uniref:Putative flippase n=1 Tax=Sulfuricella denitrificans (strain DSM 22764 / NBRC 105220 / skB26) TaxID=1163617 RepID=S6B3E2_SULDS|nr:MATE family efflux transporter [Sulfuricella denitrificans]BAN35167.1 putative flippase [Sulfuricella denitrificans skB26]
MSTKRRIIHGIGANGFGQAVTILIQLASVPILIHAWGLQLYGEWITLSAIPSYLVLSDIGLSLVAGNSLALIAEKGDIRQMQTIFQSTWVMVSSLSIVVLIPVVVIVWFIEPGQFLGLTKITGGTLSITLLLLFSHVALSMQTGILQLPFRVLKRNPFSVAAVNVIRLMEWVVATVVVLTGGGVVEVAVAFLLVRMLGNVSLWLILGRSGSPLRIGISHASLQTIRMLLRPSLASMCFPLGLSFTIQGFILLVGGMVGSIGVAVFSIYRTFTRVPIQLATAINQAIWPELSYAFGANDIDKAKKLVTKMLQFGIVLSIVSALAVYFLGETVIDLWVTKALAHNSLLLIGLTLAALVHILWQPFWVALMATNKHTRFAWYFLAISALSLLLGWVFLLAFGLTGAGYAILLAECLMFAAAFFSYNRYFRVAAND